MVRLDEQNCGDDNIATIKTSNESFLHWKKHFHRILLYFRIYADFESDNEKDHSSVGNRTINIKLNKIQRLKFIVLYQN